jgi:hypothetical protein
VEACGGVTTCVAIPADTRCWLQRPQTLEWTYRYNGKARAQRVVVAPATDACPVAALAAQLPASPGIDAKSRQGPRVRSSMPWPANG